MEKTTEGTKSPSLLDTAGMKVREWYVVYFHREPYYSFTKFLKPGFRHVELTREVRFGPRPEEVVWLNLMPMFEMLDAEISTDPRPPWVRCPGVTVQKVTTIQPYYSVRSWFDIGPPTCVEIAKAALGIRSFWIRTPWQLFKHIRERNGIIHGRRRWWIRPNGPTAAAGDVAGDDEREPQSRGERAA